MVPFPVIFVPLSRLALAELPIEENAYTRSSKHLLEAPQSDPSIYINLKTILLSNIFRLFNLSCIQDYLPKAQRTPNHPKMTSTGPVSLINFRTSIAAVNNNSHLRVYSQDVNGGIRESIYEGSWTGGAKVLTSGKLASPIAATSKALANV